MSTTLCNRTGSQQHACLICLWRQNMHSCTYTVCRHSRNAAFLHYATVQWPLISPHHFYCCNNSCRRGTARRDVSLEILRNAVFNVRPTDCIRKASRETHACRSYAYNKLWLCPFYPRGNSCGPVSVCLSVCLSQVGILSQRLDVSSWLLLEFRLRSTRATL